MKKVLCFFVFSLVIFFLVQVDVFSKARPNLPSGDYIVQVGSPVDGNTRLYRQDSSKRVFCVLKGAQAPAYGSNGDYNKRACNSSYTMAAKLRAAIGYAISTCNNTDDSYFEVQRVIHKLLNTYNSGQNVNSYNTTLYNSAVSVYNKYGNESLSLSNLSFSSSGNNWVSTSTITKSNIDSAITVSSLKNGTKDLSTSYASISGNTLTITIPKSVITTTSTITVGISGSTAYKLAVIHGCGSGIQPIAEYDTESKTVTETATASGKINIEYYLDLNGYLDGTNSGNISGYGTADVYINGTLVANDVTDYYTKWQTGTTYEIKDIKAASGKKYNGVKEGSLKGTINADKNVRLNFSSLGGLKVTKTNSSNDVLAQLDESTTVKFKLYNNSSCSGTALKDFKAGDTVSNLDPGTYYLKEYQAKKDIIYHSQEKNGIVKL